MSTFEQLRDNAYACFGLGDYSGALKQLQVASKEFGGSPELANDIAVLMYKTGRTHEALHKFREAQLLCGDERSLLVDNLIDILQDQIQSVVNHEEIIEKQAIALNKQQCDFNQFASPVINQALKYWQEDRASQLHADIAGLTDEQWADVLCDSVTDRFYRGHLLPNFIDNEMQRIFVGSSGVAALREAQNFIRVVLHYARNNDLTFDQSTRAVDFGCGWGRYTRFMLKYIQPDNLFGMDVNGVMVEHCRKSFGMGNFLKVESFPPCDLRDNLVDLVFGYSVFSHLAPECADAWIAEFARIMRPGGLLLMTTQGRSFINFCQQIRESGDRSHPWYISLSKAFTDAPLALQQYDDGAFLHYGEGQYGGTYGESVISKGYIEQSWLKEFELVDFVDSRSFLPQALFVLRRK